MLIVLDTNVLVSGLLSPYGAPAEIMGLIVGEKIQLGYDARIWREYQEVLLRPKFEFDQDDIEVILTHIKVSGRPVSTQPLEKRLPHAADEPFLEVLFSGHVECLVTGNLKHFPKTATGQARILSPAGFMQFWRK